MAARRLYAILLMSALLLPGTVQSASQCGARSLSEDEVRQIVARERAARSDLPEAFPEYRSEVRRDGCYYVLVEFGLPPTPEYHQLFRLNRDGVIVSAQLGTEAVDLECPAGDLSQSELAARVAEERAARNDLPPPFPKSKVRIARLQCLYLYYEYEVPRTSGRYQVFTIDPFGEVMDFKFNQPE